MDYSQLTDFEINKRVAQLHGGFALTLAVHDEPPSEQEFNPGRFDPCNNPADAWLIIVKNRIGLNFVNGNWRAQSLKTGWVEFCHENPLRAAMTVFLLMQERQHA